MGAAWAWPVENPGNWVNWGCWELENVLRVFIRLDIRCLALGELVASAVPSVADCVYLLGSDTPTQARPDSGMVVCWVGMRHLNDDIRSDLSAPKCPRWACPVSVERNRSAHTSSTRMQSANCVTRVGRSHRRVQTHLASAAVASTDALSSLAMLHWLCRAQYRSRPRRQGLVRRV